MSIKKLFGSTNKSRNYLAETNEEDAFKDIESSRNMQEIATKQETFVPQIDYSKPQNFAKFGSAEQYYKTAIERIVDYYPYDGSDYEFNKFFNNSLDIEKYIFNNLYPRTNGYANFDSSSYIDLSGGPHTSSSPTTAGLFKDSHSSKREFSNIYDTDIYTTAGLPNTWGDGTRESNLKANFDTGVTVEFWLKSADLPADANSVVFDMWNNNASGSVDSGRLTIEILSASAASPFLFTAQSGTISGTLFQQNIGQTITSTTLDDFNHYAFVFQNSGSNFITKFYLNGYLNDTVVSTGVALGELPPKDMQARIGAFLTVPFRADAAASTRAAGTHTLTGSVDEFRYWKAARNGEEIGRNWFTHVRGGTNTDISNTTLGLYYKFNEGTTGTNSIDSKVLDYSGRLSNGVWTGTPSRTLSSAIVEASASDAEFKDPIIYATHPEVVDLKKGLISSGSWHDGNNNASFYSLIPAWIMDEHESIGNTNPNAIAHIVGSYFDKLYLQISALTQFKQLQNSTSSATPLPFAQHLPQSLGLYTPELFVDADVVSRFLNRTEDFNFESDLTETKNLIYQNLYNNIAHIYKAKGTEKAIRNVFRCFYLDDKIVKFNTYADNTVYELQNNLQQTVTNKNSVNFNSGSNYNAVVYQKQDPDNTSESRGYISGSGELGYENIYGFTAEVDVILPYFRPDIDTFERDFTDISVYGMHSASVDDPDDTTVFASDDANFQVYAVRDQKYSHNVYFKLTSSVSPHPFGELTSSIFFNSYDNEEWNLSVRLRPSNWPVTEIVSGSDVGYTYDLIFQGINTKIGTVANSFVVSSSVTKEVGQSFLNAAKRLYVGARRTNITGTVIDKSDVYVTNARYWAKYIDDLSLQQHIFDVENVGISGSYRNISPRDPNNGNLDLLNLNTLVLDWNFNDLTASDASGRFFTEDVSSGSAETRASYGWLGKLSGYLHSGYGYGFAANTTSVVDKRSMNSFKFIDPEQAISSNMINILTNDDEVYGFTETIPNYYHTLEKSLSSAISEEMLNFFAGVIDFNNIIGEPVNRYRERYKAMEKLRETFFRKVTSTRQVEDYITYYQWFDDALSSVISQLIPASGKFTEDVLNIVESHVLERNKYKSQFPTIEFRPADPESPALGINEKTYNWKLNHHPLSDLERDKSDWWRDRAERVGSAVITSGDSDVDAQRDIIRETIENDNNNADTRLSTISQGSYFKSNYVTRRLTKPYKFSVTRKASPVPPIKGGVNFEGNKRIGYTYNALYPAGPVNEEDKIFVPVNVLFAELLDSDTGATKDAVGLKDSTDPIPSPNDKIKRRVKVQHGRDWYNGVENQSVKSDIAFPFNIISSSVTTGYNKQVVDRVSASYEITNLHNDVYGTDMEKPMQGPFTEYAVGGHQSRHVRLNTPASDATAATGFITLDKLPQDNDTITISDGATSIVFTFKLSPGAASTDVEIGNLSATRGYLRIAINEQDWNIVATESETPDKNTVLLRNVELGGHGTNVAITKTESIANTYTLNGMSGGSGPRYGLADYTTRPEAWKLLLGYCGGAVSGAIGMVGADYPWPEGNAEDETPYPMTASQKAVYYRDFTAKRPVNIRNIHHTTGSTILGNYNHNYDFVQAPGGTSNPRQFIESQPNLPTTIFDDNRPNVKAATSVRTILDIYRGATDGVYTTDSASFAEGHFDFSADYSTEYLQNTANNSVIISKFSAPGGIEVMSKGYQDFRTGEFSVYNAFNNRNLTTIRPFQHQPTVSGATEADGIRVYDIHGNDIGYYTHAARHSARFFRDSILVSNPGASFEELPSFHRVHRNNVTRPGLAEPTYTPILSGPELINTHALYFGDQTNRGMSLINAESSSAPVFLTASRTNGFTYASWIRFSPDENNHDVFSVGRAAAGLDPFYRIYKTFTLTQHRLNIDIRTRNTDPWGGSTALSNFYITSSVLDDGDWHHIAVSVPAGADKPVNNIAMYIDGAPLNVLTGTALNTFFDQKEAGGTYKYLNYITRTGETTLAIGQNSSATGIGTRPFTGSMDQITIWTSDLSADNVSDLYNGGVPCDITASAPFTDDSPPTLFAWYKLGEGTGINTDAIDTTNPGVFTPGSNSIFNAYNGGSQHNLFPVANISANLDTLLLMSNGKLGTVPVPITGCVPVVSSYSESVSYNCDNVYDNLNQYQAIPKSDRQYAWMTASMLDTDPCNFRYSGYMPVHGPAAGYYSASTGYEPWMTFISASGFGSYIIAGERGWGDDYAVVEALGLQDTFLPTAFNNLNLNVAEPVTDSTNTLGYSLEVPLFRGNEDLDQYRNTSLVPQHKMAASLPEITASIFNALMLKRNGPYGWGTFNQMNQSDHPVLINERSSSQLSIYTGESLENYNLPAVSMRGRPGIINYSPLVLTDDCGIPVEQTSTSITLKATDNNLKIFFNDIGLTNRISTDPDSVVTPFDHLIVGLRNTTYDENYLIYTENIYPSIRNEFVSSSRRRTNYDNLFWRDSRPERTVLGSTRANSFGAQCYPEGIITQSAWPLDAQEDFLTRTGSIVGYNTVYGTTSSAPERPPQAGGTEYAFNRLPGQSTAGELQNVYTQVHFQEQSGVGWQLEQAQRLRAGALYARKHMLGNYASVVGPSGMDIPETASLPGYTGDVGQDEFDTQIFINAGDALWEAGEHAGIVKVTGSGYEFVSYKSKPWYDNYSDFREDIRLMAKDYVVVPEYRISEHVQDYVQNGINNEGKFNTFEIPGTGINSTTSSFYKDYVNSEYLRDFKSTGEKIPGMTAKEIRISVKAVKKFNPYKGFYPAQRTLDLASQFSASYNSSIQHWADQPLLREPFTGAVDNRARPLLNTMWSPGIMYNSIKSGIAVDYPVLEAKPGGFAWGVSTNTYPANQDENYNLFAIQANDVVTATSENSWVRGNTFWDERLPFETMLAPEKYLANLNLVDMEPHPSASIFFTASLRTDSSDRTYSLMANNFFGEVANFFLTNGDYTTIKSAPIAGNTLTFKTGTYGARLKMYRSADGSRTFKYQYDSSGSTGAGSAFGRFGGRYLNVAPGSGGGEADFVTGNVYPLPQDPARNGGTAGIPYRENFTMYSRPSAFGPPVAGRGWGANAFLSGTARGSMDCYNGYNWAFTPPYYHGEAWVDFIFRPDPTRTYTLQEVLDEMDTYYWRVDAGPPITSSDSLARPAFITASYENRHPYDGWNVNINAMQISASLNLFGIEDTTFQETDAFGQIQSARNEQKATRWVIKPKFETPMLNFNSKIQPVSDAAGTLSLPIFGSSSLPRGMWHQFGVIEPDSRKGIFMEIDDIPKNWLRYHYLTTISASVYNNNSINAADLAATKNMKSLVDALNVESGAKRLGQIATETIVKEAVIAIPYVTEAPVTATTKGTPETELPSNTMEGYKRFFSIPKKRIKAALKKNSTSKAGQDLQAAGESIRKLVAKMDNYILPPQFDFLRNPDVEPVVMYIFEFSYKFDQDDLSYIWQNLAPRNYKKVTFEEQAIAHRLNKTQLLTAEELMTNDVRWMIFKVKQRAVGDYYSHVPTQAGGGLTMIQAPLFDPAGAQDLELGKSFGSTPITSKEYPLQFNWPYDYLSFVEGIKVDVEVLYDDESNRTRSLVRELESKETLSYGTEKSIDSDVLEAATAAASTIPESS